jgi:hypothetical protein
MKDGMPSNSVRAILKDSKGYLWLGTDAGLCRFDGKTFKIYSSDDGFTGNRIWSMAEDGEQNMWFGDYGGGLWKFDGKDFSHFTDKDSLVNNAVRSLHYSEKWKLLFIGTQFGLSIFDGTNFTNYNKENTFIDHDPYIMGFVVKENEIYICTFSQLNYLFYPADKNFVEIKPDDPTLGGSFISCFYSSQNKTFMADRQGIRVWDGINNPDYFLKPINAPDNANIGQVFGMAEDNYENIWLASWEPNPKSPGGLFLFDGEKVTKQNNILGKDPLSGWSVYYDTENKILWFGTLDMGLFMIQESIFEYIEPETFGLDKVKVNDIGFDKNGNLILVDEKNLVINYTNKADWIVPNILFFNAYRKYLFNTGIKDERAGDLASFIKVLEFKKMTFQNDTVLWVLSDPGLFKVNPFDRTIVCYSQVGYGDGDLYFDEWGRLCNVASWGYFSIYSDIESNNDRIEISKNSNQLKDISDFLFLNDETWMTSWPNGLYRGKDTVFVSYDQSNSYLSNSLNTLCADNNGNLIIGANNGEVYISKPNDGSLNILKTLSANQGIIGNSINWLKVDRNNHLWIGTNTGLNKVYLDRLMHDDSLQIFIYNEHEGYLHPNVNVSILDKDGNIWLGTDESLVRIHIQTEKQKTEKPKEIILGNCEINGTTISNKYNLLQGLKHNLNYLHFDFDVINFVNPEKDRFRYFLEGLDLAWSEYSDARHTTYPHLPPGKYTFRVEGKNLNTGTFYSPLAIDIFIRVPFWRSWWFISSIITLLSFIIVFYFKYRIDLTKEKEQKKAEVSKQLAELEMKALLAQMNPHFTFNAINSIQNYILDNDVDKALSYLSDFSKIIRQTLENAVKEFIGLDEEIDYIQRYLKLEQMRFDRQFDFEIKVNAGIDRETTLIPPMIVQPYLENAIKHGLRHKKGKGKLSIQFGIEESNILSCFIEDNGVGRKASEKVNKTIRKNHNGAGMAITKKRIQKLKDVYNSELFKVGVIDLLSTNNRSQGTRVEIFLPLIQRL